MFLCDDLDVTLMVDYFVPLSSGHINKLFNIYFLLLLLLLQFHRPTAVEGYTTRTHL